MDILIELKEAIIGEFSKIMFSYKNKSNINSKVELCVKDFTRAFDYTNDTKSIEFDFFFVSALVYGIDNLLDREQFSVDGWSREINVAFPVYNLSSFQGSETIFEEALKFLTGDYWSISFVQNSIKNIYKRKKVTKSNFNRFDKKSVQSASLFSGGLDSLIGVIDELEIQQISKKMLFVSHFDFNSSGANSDQEKLYNYLKDFYKNRIYWIQVKIALSRKDENLDNIIVESNYRSRSLLFLGLGVYLSNVDKLIVPENGTISINYPLTPSRVSSLSTRTTHPYVLNKFQAFLNKIGTKTNIVNPYSTKTKGEMVQYCKNIGLLKNILKESVSCGKRGRRPSWTNKSGTNHCGVCMPCIYRRAALNKVDLDDQLYGDFINNANSLDSHMDMPALFYYLNRKITKEQMKRDLIVNGSIPFDDLDDYADVVLRSKEEVLQLFRDKGNDFVKSKLIMI